MARPKKTKEQYLTEYEMILNELRNGTSLRTVSKVYGVGLSTCMRLKKRFL